VSFTFVYPDPGWPNNEYEYKAASLRAFDPGSETAVVAGTGTSSNGGKKERFTFTAAFQNNGDGTLSASYSASRPDASFHIPSSPGEMEFFLR
jgi:hypothetical protein